MTPLQRIGGALVAVLVMGLVVWASQAPLTVHHREEGVVRLAWSLRPERIEDCRQRTPEELARLPQHMRQQTVCEGQAAEYQLTARRDGDVVVQRTVRGGGWRRDRRLYVFHEIPMPSAESVVDIQFERLGSGPAVGPAETLPADVAPARLTFSARLSVQPREVVLITYWAEQRALIAVRNSAAR
jgi:hypothetical protein